MVDGPSRTPPAAGPAWPATARGLGLGAGVALAYFLGGRLGLSLAFVNSSASAVWPPTGIAIAALVVLGLRFWPAVLVGAFFANLATAGHWPSSAAIAIGNTLEALVGAWSVARWAAGRHAFERPRTVFAFFALAGLLAPLVSASIGVATLLAFGLAPPALAQAVWTTWWLGDAAGAIVLAPALILLASPRAIGLPPRRAETTAVFALALAIALLLWGPWSGALLQGRHYTLVAVPFVLWAALRLGPRRTAWIVVGVDAIAVWGTLAERGPFAGGPPNDSLLELQGFLGVLAVLTIPTAALALQQARAQAELRRSAEDLEKTVAVRTASLEESQRNAQASEARLRALFTNSPVGIILTRPDGKVVDLNPGAEELWGRPRAAFLAPAFRMEELYADPADRAAVLDAVRRDGRARALDVRMRRGDGQVRRMTFNVEIIDLGAGPLFLGSGVDVTALRESEERFHQLFSSNPVALAISREDGHGYADVNPAFESLTGFDRAALVDPAFDANRLWLDPQARTRLLHSVPEDGSPRSTELVLRRAEGSARAVVLSIRRIEFDGRPAFLKAMQDVTEAKAAEQAVQRAQERFARIFEASPVAISLTKVDGQVVDVNPALQALSGYSREEMLAPSFSAESLYDDPGDRRRVLVAVRESGSVRDVEVGLRRKDGQVRTVLMALDFVDLSGATTMLAMFQDVTDRRRLQEEREARIATEADLERLRRTDQFRTEFINSTAHELRTPMTPLLLALASLRHEVPAEGNPGRHLATVQRAADRLNRVIGDMVSAADLQARTIAIERRRLNLTREVRAALASHQAAAHRANLTLEEGPDEGLTVSADQARLQLVLGHLIGNALKFTPASGRIVVAAQRKGDEVKVSVADTGIGLTAKQMEGLWKPFSQAHDKAERTDSGSGLGLYITKGIIDLHGGEVGASSPGLGKGATFWFTLPLAPGHLDPLARPPTEPERERPSVGNLGGRPPEA